MGLKTFYTLVLMIFFSLNLIDAKEIQPKINAKTEVGKIDKNDKNDKTDKIVILGDSVTDGYGLVTEKAYPALLQKKLQKAFPKLSIIPSAISGSVTASAHSRLQWLIKHEKDMKGVMVVLGGNDLMRGIKPETIEKGYEKLLKVAQEAKLPVLLATMPIPMNYDAYRPQLENIYKNLGNNKNVTILKDFLKGIIGVAALNQTDGIHPNEVGHELIIKNINDQVVTWITKIKKETL